MNGLNRVEGVAQEALRGLVEAAGGRYDGPHATPVSIDRVEVLVDLLEDWGRRHAVTSPLGHYFPGRPGFWRAFDRLYSFKIRTDGTASGRRRSPS